MAALGAYGPVLRANDRARDVDHRSVSFGRGAFRLDLKRLVRAGSVSRRRNKMQRSGKPQNVGTAERWVRVLGGSLLVFIGLAYLLPSPVAADGCARCGAGIAGAGLHLHRDNRLLPALQQARLEYGAAAWT